MRDPFAILRDELVSAAARSPAVSGRRRRAWLRRRSHPLAIALGVLVISGSAAATVLSLGSSSSQPLTGKVPGAIEPASLAGYRYTIAVTPNLDAGSAFWNSSITYSNNRGVGSGSGGGGPYAALANPLFGGNGWIDSTSTQAGQHGDTVGYVLTSPYVAAVRLGSRTIRTFSSPELPTGDRAAVFFLPAGSPSMMIGWSPGQPIRSYVHIPATPGYPGPTTIPTLAVLPLDNHGNLIPTGRTNQDSFFPSLSFWQAPSAVTPGNRQPPYHGPAHPLPGVCELTQHGLPGLTAEWGHALHDISPARDSVGELFLSCIDTEYYLHGWPLQVGVLLDARRPGQVLGAIPGAKPVAGRPDTVDFEPGTLTARRIGHAWLAVQGGSGITQRLQVLGALRISKLDLPRLGSGLAPKTP